MNMNMIRTTMTLLLILFWVMAVAAVLRLCAWADTGMRGNTPVEKHINPFHAHE